MRHRTFQDVTETILVFLNNKMAAMLVFRAILVGVKALFSDSYPVAIYVFFGVREDWGLR